MRKAALILLILCFAMGLYAQAAAEATAPKELVIYSSVDEANSLKITSAFTEQTGIKVSSVHLSSGPALSRIQAEAGRPQADVWLGAPSENHIIAKTANLTIPYKSAAFDNLAPAFKDADGYWRSFYMNPMVFGINTEAMKKAGVTMPTSWADLLKPEYKGLIQMPTPQASGTAYNMITALVKIMGEDAAYAYMAKLNRNVQTYTSSGTGPSKGVGVGQAVIGIQFSPAFFQFIEEGYHSPLEPISEAQANAIRERLVAMRPDIEFDVRVVCEFRPPYLWTILDDLRKNPPDEIVLVPMYVAESDFTSGISRTDLEVYRGSGKADALPAPRYVLGFGFDQRAGKVWA
ncbi:MAG: hypothetical protein CVV52_14150, partial [Spirochaetae bacterium HGW-Spirochaetae-8]